MSLAIWKNFPHIGLMDNIKNTFWVHPHQDKTAVGEVKRVNQGIHLPYQILLSRCLLGYFTCLPYQGPDEVAIQLDQNLLQKDWLIEQTPPILLF